MPLNRKPRHRQFPSNLVLPRRHLPPRFIRRSKLLARRFVLGLAYGAGTGAGGFLVAYVIWWIQSQ